VPLRLRQTLNAVLVRIAPDAGNSRKWKLEHETVSGLNLTVLSSEDQCGDKFSGATCPAQDYFTETGVLRSHLQDAIENLYTDFQPFQNLLIPRNISVSLDETAVLTISITTLEELGPQGTRLLKNELAPINMLSITRPLNVKPGPDVKPSRLVNQIAPIYPSLAKQWRLQGTVLMNASIDDKGNVREPYVIVSAGPLLDDAAMDAVGQWKYEPLEIHGTPYSIDTTIAVVFRMDR
jgi:TonB family protein